MRILRRFWDRLFGHDIFVSYSHGDEAWAAAVETLLKRGGYAVFRDRSGLQSGDHLDRLLREVRRSTLMLVIVSDAATQSDWVHREFLAHLERPKPRWRVVPVFLDRRFPHALPERSRQLGDFRGATLPVDNLSPAAVERSQELLEDVAASFAATRRSTLRRSVGFAAALGVLTLVGLLVWSWRQTDVARTATALADSRATARRLAATVFALHTQNPELQLLLAYEASRIGLAEPVQEVWDALLHALALRGGRAVTSQGPCRGLESVRMARLVRRQDWLIVEGRSDPGGRVVCAWSLQFLESPAAPVVLPLSEDEEIIGITDGERRFIVAFAKTRPEFHVWNIDALANAGAPGVRPRVIPADQLETGSYSELAGRMSVDDAGRWIVSAASDSVWMFSLLEDRADGNPALVLNEQARRVQLSSDGAWLFTSLGSGPSGPCVIWSVSAGATGEARVVEMARSDMRTDFAVFSPDSRWLLTSVGAWRLAGERPLASTQVSEYPSRIGVFDAASRWVVTSSGVVHLDETPIMAASFRDADWGQFEHDGGGVFVVTGAGEVFYEPLPPVTSQRDRLPLIHIPSGVSVTVAQRWLAIQQLPGDGEQMLARRGSGATIEARFPVTGETATSGSSRDSSRPWYVSSAETFAMAAGRSDRAIFFAQADTWLVRIARRADRSEFDLVVIPLSPAAYGDEAKRVASRNMTQQEWAEHMLGQPYRKTFEHLPAER